MLNTMIVSVFSGATGIDINQIEVFEDGHVICKIMCNATTLSSTVLKTLETTKIDKVILMGDKKYNEKLKKEINDKFNKEVLLIDFGGKIKNE